MKNEIRNALSEKSSLSHKDFAEYLRDYFRILYPEYQVNVNVYDPNPWTDLANQWVMGSHHTSIYNEHGRNVVVSYTLRSSNFPGSSTLAAIEQRVVDAIKLKVKQP